MANTFHCEVVAPEGKEFSGEVEFVSLPAVGGEMGVMAHHEPVIAVLGIGKIRIRPEGASEPTICLAVSGGYAEVSSKGVLVLADRVIDTAIIEAAMCKERIADLEKRESDMGDDQSIPGRDWVSTQLEWERFKLSLATK